MIAKLWNQASPSTDELIKIIWFICKGNFNQTKNDEIMPFSGKWMELEINLLSKGIHDQKDKYCMFSLICRIKSGGEDMKVEGKLTWKKEGQ
jgi:hypothetical protein